MTKIKICGITNLEDALMATETGADAVGFIFSNVSQRKISPDRAAQIINKLPPFVQSVGVFVNQSAEEINKIVRKTNVDLIQLHGNESPTFCQNFNNKVIKAIHVKKKTDLFKMTEYKVAAFLLDSKVEGKFGGTGQTFNWDLAVEAKKLGPVILSGGLNTENVSEAVTHVQPYAVDVASGVEVEPGIKDPDKLIAFVKAVRNLDASCEA
jgi:phosphoribosylanthranilate isomerase